MQLASFLSAPFNPVPHHSLSTREKGKNRWDGKWNWTIWRERLRADDNIAGDVFIYIQKKSAKVRNVAWVWLLWEWQSMLSDYRDVESRRCLLLTVVSPRKYKKAGKEYAKNRFSLGLFLWLLPREWMTPLRVLSVNEEIRRRSVALLFFFSLSLSLSLSWAIKRRSIKLYCLRWSVHAIESVSSYHFAESSQITARENYTSCWAPFRLCVVCKHTCSGGPLWLVSAYSRS